MGRLTRPRVHVSTRPRDGSTRGQWTLCTHPPFLGLHAWAMDALHPPPVFRAPRVGYERSTPTPRF